MIRVLVVEDDPAAAEAHAVYTERVPGFAVTARAATAAEALRRLGQDQTDADNRIDLVLLDMHLPDLHGLHVCRAMRMAGHDADVMAVTSVRDAAVVRAAVSHGIVQYLLKPFTFAILRDKLERYAEYRRQLGTSRAIVAQHEVDQVLATLRDTRPAHLPKRITRESLDAVTAVLRVAGRGLSATEVGATTGTSRVTARRYLEYLATVGVVGRSPRYGGLGRPETEYRWAGSIPAHAAGHLG